MNDKQKGLGLIRILIFVVIIGALASIAWNLWPTKTDKNANDVAVCPNITQVTGEQSFQLPGGWNWYENKDIGLKFAYPGSWESPTNQTNSGVEAYLTSFTENPSGANIKVLLSPDCTDFQSKLSDINSGKFDDLSPPTITKAIEHNQTSYSALSNWHSDAGNQYELITNKEISVGRIRSILVDYSLITGSEVCPDDKLASSAQPKCINQTISDEVNEIISSLQQI